MPRTLARVGHLRRKRRRTRPLAAFEHFGRIDAAHLADEVDAVLERAAELALIAVDLGFGALAQVLVVSQVATRARVGCGDQLELCRKHRPALRTRQHDDPVFERLAQRLQRGIGKLPELV